MCILLSRCFVVNYFGPTPAMFCFPRAKCLDVYISDSYALEVIIMRKALLRCNQIKQCEKRSKLKIYLEVSIDGLVEPVVLLARHVRQGLREISKF